MESYSDFETKKKLDHFTVKSDSSEVRSYDYIFYPHFDEKELLQYWLIYTRIYFTKKQ